MTKYTDRYRLRTPSFLHDTDFCDWIDQVEDLVISALDLYLLDLPDEDYIIHYSNKTTPEEMFKIILSSNGLELEL